MLAVYFSLIMVQVADYAIANKIDDKPAFVWWFPTYSRNVIASCPKSNLSIGSLLTNLVSRSLRWLH
jgi:hypothetical protein